MIYSNGSWWLDGGTSLSAPLWAAMLNLINEERLAGGKKTMGWIHPILVCFIVMYFREIHYSHLEFPSLN